ncbi:glycine betaine/L-proline ABC transporter ATP-binding protein [Weissella confusa]|jgi:glycine betaine/L-proline transport ATP binding subunit|uniref:Quaternary amine transport ATP-binding protein n=1 Tax=Weissella confusa TaxID=1583 RepID=A0A0R2FCS0_WEICO|nr:glycine betaine/L-proline ABC transporter ATP-binding protein [Weissella confusa]COI37523.1 glycine-betaine ABC transporter ATPase component [Streptococcus pneumoniae]KRN22828.1 betaine ABC transporter ATP binding protein [Weissella confusa]MBD1491473.1 glycine betaine/L-proline ABC transporter ATP-binding protein [Weissella confusa]MBD5834243.1 glycine betaine/L-proline ABC transporter ATP-binding protein [Weissella confusa]MBF7057285.1 glycine betaine/L-proline ABC transporter ATP-binding
MAKVEIEHLTKIFGKRVKPALQMVQQQASKTEILKKTGATVGVYDANLSIEEGEIFVIMGLSGSGKSTLIRLLNRLIEPTSGSIKIDGEDISTMSKEQLLEVRRKKMSMVFQSFGLFPHRTILENTEYGLEVQGVPKEERRERAEKALDNANLLAFKDQYPNQLSGGMQQRVGLARALANNPEILLMDEAFSALDPLIRRDMQDELLDLQANASQTIIFISHDLNEALRIGDRIAIMKDGQIQQVGTGEEILTAPANDYVRAFIEDVDRSKVLTAERIMIPPITTNIDVDGPAVALKKMRTEEVSGLVAVDRRRQFQGFISSEDALRARRENIGLRDVMTEMPTVARDMLVADIMPLIYDAPTPLAVVDNGRLLGVIIRGRVLEALSETEVQ